MYYLITAPVANALGMKFSMRRVVFIGGLFTALSAFLTSFAPNIYYIIIVFGVWTGNTVFTFILTGVFVKGHSIFSDNPLKWPTLFSMFSLKPSLISVRISG